MNTLVRAQKMTKTFGDTVAVNQVSLQVRAGEIYGLVGPDGAGKTTTMRLLCGALSPDTGEITVGEYSMVENPDKAREQIGYLSQKFSMYEDLTVKENIRFFAEVRGIPREDWHSRSMEILEFVGLSAFIDRRAVNLSGGMKQKLGLACALVHRPRILLLDEPTGGVDPVTRQDFWQLIIKMVAEQDTSVLVSTPYMDEAVRCTYVGFLKNGHLVVEDKPRALRDRLAGRIIELRGRPLNVLRSVSMADQDVEGVQAFGDRLHIRIRENNAPHVITRLKSSIQGRTSDHGATIDKIDMVDPSLEDVFIAILEG